MQNHQSFLLRIAALMVIWQLIGVSAIWGMPQLRYQQLQAEGWNVYTDALSGFTIAYPPDWTSQTTIENSPSGNDDVLLQQVEFADSNFSSVRVSIWPHTSGQSVEMWWETTGRPQFASPEDLPPTQAATISGASALIVYPQPNQTARWIITVTAHTNYVILFEFYAPITNTTEVDFHTMLESVTWSPDSLETTSIPPFLPAAEDISDGSEQPALTEAAPSGAGVAVTTCCGKSSPNNPFPCDSSRNNGNCTWWAFHKRPDIPCRGNADTWAACAGSAGFLIDNNPQAGDVIVYPVGNGSYTQHVAYVEQVHNVTATTIDYTISQMSWGLNSETNNCGDSTRNGTPYRISSQKRSGVAFIHRKTSSPSPTYCTSPDYQYCVEYYNNLTLSGSPVAKQTIDRLSMPWGYGSPSNGVNADNFSARFKGRRYFPTSGWWNFWLGADDGVRMWIDGQLVVDRWTDSAYQLNYYRTTLSAGFHEVKVEYYERSGYAAAHLCAAPHGEFCTEYFNHTGANGAPTFTVWEGSVNKNWGTGGPGSNIGSDNFSIRSRGRHYFTGASQIFQACADDGVRLWVDGVLQINKWLPQPYVCSAVRYTPTAGWHDIQVDYYEAGGSAAVKVWWYPGTQAVASTGLPNTAVGPYTIYLPFINSDGYQTMQADDQEFSSSEIMVTETATPDSSEQSTAATPTPEELGTPPSLDTSPVSPDATPTTQPNPVLGA